MSEIKVTIATANLLYREGGEYMKVRVLKILNKELERHRKGSSGHATIESLIEKVVVLPTDD